MWPAVDSPDADRQRLARVIDLIRARVPLEGLRVLDLACRTGVFTAGLAAEGADVLGIEGRWGNLAHAPEGRGVTYLKDDVRELSVEQHGHHDVTLCLGILYHLSAPDAIMLLTAMRSVTQQFAIIDTHVALDATDSVFSINGERYDGVEFEEGEPGPWSSIGNDTSWWFTEPSLTAAILRAGWTVVERVPGSGWDGEALDRRWLVIS